MRHAALDVRIAGNLVTIGAGVKSEKEDQENGRVLRRELQPGFASCCFTLSRALERQIGRLEPRQAPRQGARR